MNKHRKNTSGSIWAESGVALGEILGTTSLLATVRWASDERTPAPAGKEPRTCGEKETPSLMQRRVFAPPVEAPA